MLRPILLGAVASLAFAGAAPAQITNPEQFWRGFNLSDIAVAANELGYQTQIATLDNGITVLAMQSENAVFYAQGAVCEATSCKGLGIYAVLNNTMDPAFATINEFHQQQSIVTIFKTTGGTALRRYLIADYGTPKGNVASDLYNFEKQAAAFAQIVRTGANTISAKIEGAAPPSEKPVEASFVSDLQPSAEFHKAMQETFATDASAQ